MKEKYKILIAEDEALARELINHVLKENNYQPVIVENGKMALEYLKRESFPVVITDLDMPIMGGRELILEIQANFPDTIVIVETLHFESDIIIDIMKMGVFDYLIKPIKAEDLLLKVSRGLDAAILKKNHRVYEKEKLLRMESQLEWLKWQSKNLSNTHLSKNSFYDAVFENLKTNLSQGAGFGAIISISELICNSPKNEDNQYLIDAGIVDFLRENTMHAQKIIQTFGELDDLVGQKKFNLSMTVQEVYNLLKEEVEASKKFAEVKHHNIM
ncbi:MAG: response regulator, partial [Leptospiraceae bacterium]|nr:response regulator [Leptospiraceae bacterium]